jgi:hypothetical protein
LNQFSEDHGPYEMAEDVAAENHLGTIDRNNLETLFAAASIDKTKTAVLKAELDRLGEFSNFEDRFLDLFRECS